MIQFHQEIQELLSLEWSICTFSEICVKYSVCSTLCWKTQVVTQVVRNYYLWFYCTFRVVIFECNFESFQFIPLWCFRNDWKYIKSLFEIPFAFHFPPYFLWKSEAKIFITVIKVKLLVSKTSNSCFKSLDFFQMLLASHN